MKEEGKNEVRHNSVDVAAQKSVESYNIKEVEGEDVAKASLKEKIKGN